MSGQESKRAERRMARAIRVAPAEDRERYGSEWRSDARSAPDLGLAATDVAKGASRLAWRLRIRLFQRVLLGQRGAVRCLTSWVGLVVLAAAAFLLGSIPLLVLVAASIALVMVLATAGSPTRWLYALTWASATGWVACTVYYWWAWGVVFEASDAFQPIPRAASYGGPAFVAGGGFFVAFWALVAVSVARARRLR